MKKINSKKLIVYSIFALLIGGLVCIYNIKLVKTYNREGYVNVSYSIKRELITQTEKMNDEEIVDYCVELTAKLLTFSFNQDPLFKNKVSKAHCVTYARVCSSLCNIALKAHNKKAKATPVVGYAKIFGVNLCEVLCAIFPKSKNRLKAHDFVEVRLQNEKLYVDPSLYDLIYIDAKRRIH